MSSLEAIGRFVTASECIRFEAENRQQRYSWVERVLIGPEYALRCKATRGLPRRCIELLASADEAHETLRGPAKRRILEREHALSNKPEYARLAGRRRLGLSGGVFQMRAMQS